MSTVAEIKAAIPKLTLEEREELTRYLQDFDDDWDRQMAEDAKPGGKLWKLMQNSEKDIAEGRLIEFPCDKRKRKLR